MKKKGKNEQPVDNRPTSLLRLYDMNSRGDDRQQLFRAVSERLRTGLLTEDEADLIAEWFARLGRGEDPQKVLYGETRGRKRGSTGSQYLKGRDVSLPDHIDLCWSIRRAIARTGDPDKVFEVHAKHFGRTADYIKRLYEQYEPVLGKDSELHK